MIEIKTIKDVYSAVDELMHLLTKNTKQKELAKMLRHRMYEVSWTTGSEVYSELNKVFRHFTEMHNINLDDNIIIQINKIIRVIDEYFKDKKIPGT